MDIRYFAYIADRLKRVRCDSDSDARARGETVSQRAFVDEGSQAGSTPAIGSTRTLGVRIPPGAQGSINKLALL